MKRLFLIILPAITLLISLSALVMDDNGRAGVVGSPGETTCNTNQCHNSFTVNSGPGSVSASSSMNNWTYEPFGSYTISIKVAMSGFGLFGFGAELLNSSNTNAGTLTVSDAVHTQVKTASGKRNIVHKLNGGLNQDSMIFSFSWTAPDTTAGDLTLYFCGNASNANNQPAGDYIFCSTQVVSPAMPAGFERLISRDPFSFFPNPARQTINLHYFLKSSDIVNVKLYSLNGSAVYSLSGEYRNAGENNVLITLPAECSTGIYILSLESPSGKVCRKLAVERN